MDPNHDAVGREWARKMAGIFQEEMKKRKREGDVKFKVEGVGQYGNYDSEFSRRPVPLVLA